VNGSTEPSFSTVVEERAPFVGLAAGDQQAHAVRAEDFQLLGKLGECRGDRRAGGRAVLAEKAAILEPDHLGTAEKRQRIQRLAEPAEAFEGLGRVDGVGIHDLVVHAPEFGRPLVEQRLGALLDCEIVVPQTSTSGAVVPVLAAARAIRPGRFRRPSSPPSFSSPMRVSTSLMSSTSWKSLAVTKIGFFCMAASARQSLGRASISTSLEPSSFSASGSAGRSRSHSSAR
jgi:hypothetical protein